MLLYFFLQGVIDYSFDPFISNCDTIRTPPNELEVLGELHVSLNPAAHY